MGQRRTPTLSVAAVQLDGDLVQATADAATPVGTVGAVDVAGQPEASSS